MARVALVDGATVPEGRPAISPFDRGVVHGEGVFETMRSYGDAVFAVDEHLARLGRSAALVGLGLPCALAEIARDVAAARRAFGADDCVVRIVLTGGEWGGRATRIVLAEPLSSPPAGRYEAGFAVLLKRGAMPGVAGAKTTSYLGHLLARREAEAAGADEALLVDDAGDVLEGATSNVFVVRAGVVRTPPLDGRILDGITRAHVLIAARALGLAVEEAAISLAYLMGADEAFLTSTLREVAAVAHVDGRAAFGGAPGPVARALLAAFRAARERQAAPC